MLRDVREAPLRVLLLVLPTLIRVPAVRRGSPLSLVAPGILLAQVVVWLLY